MTSEIGYMPLSVLREVAKYYAKLGIELRSDLIGFLKATEDAKDNCMVFVGPHSIALSPENHDR